MKRDYFGVDFIERLKAELELLDLTYDESLTTVGGRKIDLMFIETAVPSAMFGFVGDKKVVQRRMLEPEELAGEIYIYLEQRNYGPSERVNVEFKRPDPRIEIKLDKPPRTTSPRTTSRRRCATFIMGPSGCKNVSSLQMSDFTKDQLVMTCIGQIKKAEDLTLDDLEPADQLTIEKMISRLDRLNDVIRKWRPF